MKKIVLLFSLIVVCNGAIAQDTLLFESFDVDPTANWSTTNNGNDTVWVNFDADGLPDANPAVREQNWWWSAGGFGSADTSDGCLYSSSWLAGFLPGNRNWLMTPPIQIVDANAVLSWTSAPRQTPLYLDGFIVLVSTTDNVETSFTDTLFEAGQHLTGTTGASYSQYTFSPGFIHGIDGTYIEWDFYAVSPPADSSAFLGVQRPFTESLAAYAGQTIYITFLHNSDDDNLISIDDILVTGTMFTGISENTNDIELNVYPNPARDIIELSYYLPSTSPISYSIFDITGKLVATENRGLQILGNQNLTIDVSTLSSGQYSIAIEHTNGMSTVKFIKE